MSPPTDADWQKLKRVGRYLVGRPRMVLKYRFQQYTNGLTYMVDSDYAGCLKTRKSTNGGVIMMGKRCLETWSSSQAVIALSSGEAELYGLVKGASVLLGMLAVANDLNIPLKGEPWSDSSAETGIASRKGFGKVRHLHTQYLWAQERLSSKDFLLHKVCGDKNMADLLTKHLGRGEPDKLNKMLGFQAMEGVYKLTLTAA